MRFARMVENSSLDQSLRVVTRIARDSLIADRASTSVVWLVVISFNETESGMYRHSQSRSCHSAGAAEPYQ